MTGCVSPSLRTRLLFKYKVYSKTFCSVTEVERKWYTEKYVPKYFNYFEDVIKFWAEEEKVSERRDHTAFWYIDENKNEIKWSFQELVHRTEKTSSVLRSCGLERNHRIIIVLPKIVEWWLINLASIQLGIVSSPGTTQLRQKDLLYRINRFKAKCIFADFETAERVDEIADQCPSLETKVLCSADERRKDGWLDFSALYDKSKPFTESAKTKMDEPINVFFTSGTTGNPKMVKHGHMNHFSHCINRKYWIDINSDDVFWNLADTGWAKTAWGSMFVPWSSGTGVFVHHSPRFDPELTIKVLQDYPITSFCAPPTAYRMMTKLDLKKHKFSHLKKCCSGGESVTPSLCNKWKELTDIDIMEVYGQTETCLLLSTRHCSKRKPGSIGLPPPHVSLTIINEACEEVKTGEEGDIAIKTKPNVPIGHFLEYLDDPKKTAAAYRNEYYITGDRAYKDEDGYFWFVGRNDDVIISAGYRIGPFEVENALQEHPAVAEAGVVGSPDDVRGEVVKAFIVLREDYQHVDKNELIATLQNHVKNVTSPYKYPRKIEFVKELPKTISEKVQRFKLREKERKTIK